MLFRSVFDVATQKVKIGNHDLGINVVLICCCRSSGSIQVNTASTLQDQRHRQSGSRLPISRVGIDKFAIFGHCSIDVSTLQSILGWQIPRIHRLLAGLGIDFTGPRLVATGKSTSSELLQDLGQGITQLCDRRSLLQQWHRTPLSHEYDEWH